MNQAEAINWALLLTVIAGVAFGLSLYRSRELLRRLAAWAEGRAAAIDHQCQIARAARSRLGVESGEDRAAARLEQVTGN